MPSPHGRISVVNRRHATLIAAVIAAAAVSACSSNAAPAPWPDSTPSPVSASAPVWADVTGQGKVQFDRGNPKSQYGDPAPGVSLLRGFDGLKPQLCSIGPAVVGGFLTAGHCSTYGDSTAPRLAGVEQFGETSADGDKVSLGTSTPAPDVVDAAVIRTSAAAGQTKIAGTWPVAGVLTPAGVERLVPKGAPVCFDGAASGVVCGERIADRGGLAAFNAVSIDGDSGAPVFAVDSQGRAAVIGILKGGNATSSTATYVEGALVATGTAVQLDPQTTQFDGDAGLYSPRFSK